MEAHAIDVRPISGALGAEIAGIDLSSALSNAAYDAIHRALLDHLVIFFRDQDLSPEQHTAFARRFGKLHIHPFVRGMDGYPHIVEVIKEKEENHHWGGSWHADVTFQAQPAMGAVLYAREVPPYGGDTMFANMYRAYETLSDGLKATLGRLRAVHYSGAPRNYSAKYRGMQPKDGEEENAVHPLVRTHPETGRKSLFIARSFTRHFEGMTEDESRPLLDFLFVHATRPEHVCRFRWQKNSIAFWDNRCTMHKAIADFHGATHGLNQYRRVMHRVTLEGGRPV